MRAFFPLILTVPFALSACGGSTTSSVDKFNNTFDSTVSPFFDEVDVGSATTLTTTPTESSASMSGLFAVGTTTTTTSDVDAVAGQMTMNANFAANTVSGSMTDFIEIREELGTFYGTDVNGSASYSGTLNVNTGVGDDIAASGAGSYTGTDGNRYAITFTMDGDIYRRPSSDLGAYGLIDATVTGGGGTVSANGDYYVTE